MASSHQNRGHLALKSSVLAPTAMSYMGQDLILNHMKSHYRRISSAKATVDTSAPKSMKKHMRVRDQKKRETINNNPSEGPLMTGRRARSSSLEDVSVYAGPSPSPISRPQSSRQHHRSNSTNMKSPYRPQSAGSPVVMPNYSTPTSTPRNNYDHEAEMSTYSDKSETNYLLPNRNPLYKSGFSPRVLPGPLVSQTRWKSVQNRESPRGSQASTPRREPRGSVSSRSPSQGCLGRDKVPGEYMVPRGLTSRYKERNIVQNFRDNEKDFVENGDLDPEDSPSELSSTFQRDPRAVDINFDSLRGYVRDSGRARVCRVNSPALDVSHGSSSVTTPVSRRQRNEWANQTKICCHANVPTMISKGRFVSGTNGSLVGTLMTIGMTWQQEDQLYMQFISDVTSDILARGIFSNRVLNNVFESHIDRRKDELDEDRMREMIAQLRVDLNVEN